MASPTYDDRLEEIRRAEHRSRSDTLLRILLVGIGATAYYIARPDPLVILWFIAHTGSELTIMALLARRNVRTPLFDIAVVLAAYAISGLIFLSLPIWILADAPGPGMIFAAAVTLIGYTIYLLHRRQRDSAIIAVDICLLLTIFGAAAAIALPLTRSWQEAALVLVADGALTTYVIVSLLADARQQAQLREAQQKYANAQKARALNQFVGGVAHDFNNQLTVILGHLELFEMLDTPEDRMAALDLSRRAARRAASTVQQLLASSGRTRLNPMTLPLGGFLDRLQDLLGDLLDPGMQITIIPPVDAPTAYVDADMLETCLVQLCLNAQDATLGNGKVRIWVETSDAPPDPAHNAESPPPYTVIFVEDNGPGVPEEALALLTEPFYTTKGKTEASGLGLSAVSGFARQSGGLVHITRAPRAGLRIALVLPAEQWTAPPSGTGTQRDETRGSAIRDTDINPDSARRILTAMSKVD
ncbi:ATP-binding protein [Sagittula sp.]|uniref:ATP-binding protein n=1 Tax=Sagittula sp. TaxID=2038081 RepID=UPI00351675C4